MSLEQGIVWTCGQSLAFRYDYDSVWSSEVVRTFETPQDWARTEARVLQFMLRGAPGNATTGQMYVTLDDGQTEQRVPYAGDLHILAEPQWHVCRIALPEFNQVNLAHVTSMAIGLRPATTDPQERGMGTIYLDDIVLRPAVCLENRDAPDSPEGRPAADLTGDCTVDYRDLQRLAKDWLYDRTRTLAVAAPNEPILWYDFEGDARDQAGTADGQIQGRCNFVPGVYGRAIEFPERGRRRDHPAGGGRLRADPRRDYDYLLAAGDRLVPPERYAVLLELHLRPDESDDRDPPRLLARSRPIPLGLRLSVVVRESRGGPAPGQDASGPAAGIIGRSRKTSAGAGWRSISTASCMTAAPARTRPSPVSRLSTIGSGWYGRYDGAIDDFRIYDYALSAAEVAHVATRGTGLLPQPPDSPADLNADGTVNFRDLALLATQWLQNNLWP